MIAPLLKKLSVVAALITGALLPSIPAFGQAQVPLSYHTVWGRLGAKPGDSGPGQAIPFASLLSNLKGIAWGGKARMIPHLGQTQSPSDCFTLTDPYGNPIACSTSTTSQGLQEFLNAATANGWPAEVDCQGINFPINTNYLAIYASTSVTVPVAQDWSFHSYGCPLIFNVTTVPGLIVDSNGASEFDWDGIIIYQVTAPNGDVTISPSCAIYINPVTNTADGFASLYAGVFRVKSVSVNASGGIATAAVCANTTVGGVHQVLEFQEMQTTGGAYYGFLEFGVHGVQGSRITMDQPHGTVKASIRLETVIAGYNLWTVNNVSSDGFQAAGSKGIETSHSNDSWNIGSISGYPYGIYVDSGAIGNRFDYASILSATTAAILDNGTCTWYSGPQGSQLAIWGATSGCQSVTVPAAASGGTVLEPGTMATWARHGVADANYTALTTDRYIGYSSITASRTVTLPAAASYPIGQPLIIADESGSVTGAITISAAAAGSDTVAVINGSGTTTGVGINVPHNSIILLSNGTNQWTVVGKASPSLGAVTNALLATMPADTIKCNPTGSPAVAQDCTTLPIILSSGGGFGYATGVGAGGAVTQLTSRTTGVTLNTLTGAITLLSAAGSATPATFTVTNSTVAATDVIHVVQKSGSNLYEIFVTAVSAGSFNITQFTTGGTTSEAPVFNFAVIKGSAN